MKFSLKSKLSLTIAIVVLLTVALISMLSNYFIQDQFKGYIASQQQKATEQIVKNIGAQYDEKNHSWDVDFVHAIGMSALNEGYIIKVYNDSGSVVWDAETCDMILCTNVMDEISHRMMEYPGFEGEYTTEKFPVIQGTKEVGIVSIGFYGPFCLSEDDFRFLDALNRIFLGVGILSLLVSVAAGVFLARNLSNPILKTVEVTKNIADGKYGTRISEKTGTKEVDQLIESINHLAQALEKQEALRRRLTADVAHELRTPLTTVQTHIEAILEGVWEPTKERLESCYAEMNRLSILVSDLESLAKVESENLKLNKTELNLADLIEKTLSSHEMEFQDKNLKVVVSGSCPAIMADRDRISQVLINLISNAVKYTEEGGEIRITLSDQGDTVNIQVEDNGIGISQEELPHIFERFYRTDKSRNRTTGGAGIGLAIVKSIVMAHDGKIEVESKENEGSCFTVMLPK